MVVQVSEAWALRGVDSESYDRSTPVSESPDREEVIVIIVHTAFGSTIRTLPIDPETRQLQEALPPPKEIQGRMQVAQWLAPAPDEKRH